MTSVPSSLDDQLSQRFIALDPSGYFLIKVDADAAELVVEHYSNDVDDKGRATDPRPVKCWPAAVADQEKPAAAFAAAPPRSSGSRSPKVTGRIRSVVSTMPCISGASCRKPRSA